MSDAGNRVVNRANVMRVPGAQRPLVLVAHAAARAMSRLTLKCMLKRLLPRRTWLWRTSAGRRPAWTPMLLRWARHSVAVWSRGALRAPALPARPASQFHWHFHLAALRRFDRERREARTPAVTGPFQARAPASRMNPPRAVRMDGKGYRFLRGPRGTIEGARAIHAYPQSASIGRGRFAALAESAKADAWKASPALGTERTSYKRRWLERAAAHARWLRGEAGSHLAKLPHAPAGQSFLTRDHLQTRAQSFDQTRAAGRNASGDALLTSTSMASRSPMAALTAMTSTRRSIYVQVQAGLEEYLRQTHGQVTRTLLWSKREHAAAHAFDAPPPRTAGRQPGEETWRARNPAATATHSPGLTAVPRTGPGIAMRRPVDLVWLASPASSAPPGEPPRYRTASAASVPSAPSIQAVAGVPAASGRASDNTVVRATALDPVLAARLADEVIRRIDHRARIERERRGL